LSIFLKSDIGDEKLTAKQILSDPILILAFGFGSGLVKKAPGTCGTLAAIPIYWILAQTNNIVYSMITIIVLISGISICGRAAEKLGEHDFGGIVWDEIAGYLITMWWVAFSWKVLVVGFVLFRIFDIFKPWPISWADKHIEGGMGIMLDDVLAGLFSAMLMLLIFG
jgi:phosphatidylglycerophosphatase A